MKEISVFLEMREPRGRIRMNSKVERERDTEEQNTIGIRYLSTYMYSN